MHLQFLGPKILQTTLNKYREKSLLIKLVAIAQDFDASLESLENSLFYSEKQSDRLIWEKSLFYSNRGSVRLLLEYTNMGFQDA